MALYWAKQFSSRPLFSTLLTSSTPIKSASETYQLRISSTAAAAVPTYLTIADSSTVSPTTAAGAGTVPIVGTVAAEYFTISPGQWYSAAPGGVITATEVS